MPSAMPRRPSPQFSRRWAVTTTMRWSQSYERLQLGVGELDVDRRGPLQRVDAGVAGDEDLPDRDVLRDQVLEVLRGRGEVQRRRCDEMSWRLSSSGNGVRLLPPVRRPASTCITGMRRWKAESAAAMAEVVSPWTRTAAGKRPLRMSSGSAAPSGSTSKRSAQKSSKR